MMAVITPWTALDLVLLVAWFVASCCLDCLLGWIEEGRKKF